jgi:alkylation response protein AidB-like acyl-CoA dehydrogenase
MKYQDVFPVPAEWVQEVDESLAETVSAWAEREVRAKRLEFREDHEKLIKPAVQKLFVDLGLGAMFFPDEVGGGGMGAPDAAMTSTVVLEQVGAADTGIGFELANTLTLQSMFAIEPHRDESMLGETAPIFCGEKAGVASLVLPAYGPGPGDDGRRFNGLDYQVAAEKEGDGWVLSGDGVRPQCSGATADLFGVAFPGEDGAPVLGLVGSDAAGLEVGEPFKKTGLWGSINSDLGFDGVRVPGEMVVFEGREPMMELLARYYAACAAVCIGALFAGYEIIKEWGNTRVIKGKGQVFKENPLVASLMGEIGGGTATGRLLAYDVARLLSRPDEYGPPGSPAMFATATAVFKQVSRSAMLALDNIMELMASAGYATEWNLERYWRDVKTLETYVVPETAAKVDMARHYFDLQSI